MLLACAVRAALMSRCCYQTPEVDLKSALGMRLKREMLAAVSRRTFYPDDQARVDEVYERYRRYLIPVSRSPPAVCNASSRLRPASHSGYDDPTRDAKMMFLKMIKPLFFGEQKLN